MNKLLRALLCLELACKFVKPEENVAPKQDENVSVNVTLMSWNILAPMWIDRDTKKADGVDLSLLDWDIRIKLIADEILKQNPDLLTLQEVQEDVLKDLSRSIRKKYKVVAFAPNQEGYWKSYLPDGMEYVKNGVATFYNRKKFGRVSSNLFETSSNGSIALTSVLYPRLAGFHPGKLSGYGHPVIVMNCHQHDGRKVADRYVRAAQGTIVMQEANKTREHLLHEAPGSLPSVIIAGDLNSVYPWMGFTIYKENGYLDALETAGDPTKSTFFFPRPVPLPWGGFVTGTAIDHVFISSVDTKDGRIELLSADVPDISSDDLSEDSYVKKLKKMAIFHIRRHKFEKSAKILSTILNITMDEEEYDTQVNRVLRVGSDHMPLIVQIKLVQ